MQDASIDNLLSRAGIVGTALDGSRPRHDAMTMERVRVQDTPRLSAARRHRRTVHAHLGETSPPRNPYVLEGRDRERRASRD